MTVSSELENVPPVAVVHRDALVTGKLRWRCLLAALAVAIIFTVVVVHWSQEHGRLSTMSNWDDSMYLTHGWLSAATLQERGILKFLGFERSWPPHSIYVDLQCMAGFLLLGFTDSSPYYFSCVSVTASLVLLGILTRWNKLATGALWALFLATPMAFQMVHMVKADVACGVWFVLGAALLLEGRLMCIGTAELLSRLLPFFVAILCRPPGLIYLLPLFAVCWLLAWTREWLAARETGETFDWSVALRRVLLPVVGLVVLAPYYFFAYRWFRGYFTDAYKHRDYYSPARSALGDLVYYFEPHVFVDTLGVTLPVALAACAALLVLSLRDRDAGLRGNGWFWLASTGIAWLGITVAYYKTPLIGSTFYIFVFCALPLLWRLLQRPLVRAWLVALIVVTAGTMVIGTHWSAPDECFGTGRNDPRTQTLFSASSRVIELARAACATRAAAAGLSPQNLKLRVFFTSDAYLNYQNFEYEMAKAGFWKVDGLGLDFSPALDEQLAAARRSDLVVACDAGANWPYPTKRPAEALQDKMVQFLKGDAGFSLLGDATSLGEKKFYVFENLQPRVR